MVFNAWNDISPNSQLQNLKKIKLTSGTTRNSQHLINLNIKAMSAWMPMKYVIPPKNYANVCHCKSDIRSLQIGVCYLWSYGNKLDRETENRKYT